MEVRRPLEVETVLGCDHKQLCGIQSDAVDTNAVRCLPDTRGKGLALLEAPH